MAQSARARPKTPQKSHNRRVPGPSGLPGRKPATPHAAGSWPRSRRAATRGGGNPVIELEYRITVYPARDGHDQWRAVWYENAKRRQCEAVSGGESASCIGHLPRRPCVRRECSSGQPRRCLTVVRPSPVSAGSAVRLPDPAGRCCPAGRHCCRPGREMGVCRRGSGGEQALVRRYYQQVLTGHDRDLLARLLDSSFVSHGSGGSAAGAAAYTAAVAAAHAAFPDLVVTVQDQIAEADMVVTRWSATGTHAGDFAGVPATGRRVTVTGI